MKRFRLIHVFLTVLATVILYSSGLVWAAGPCTTERVFGNQIKVFYDENDNCAVTEVCFEANQDTPELLTLNYHDHLPEDLKADPMRRDQNVAE